MKRVKFSHYLIWHQLLTTRFLFVYVMGMPRLILRISCFLINYYSIKWKYTKAPCGMRNNVCGNIYHFFMCRIKSGATKFPDEFTFILMQPTGSHRPPFLCIVVIMLLLPIVARKTFYCKDDKITMWYQSYSRHLHFIYHTLSTWGCF